MSTQNFHQWPTINTYSIQQHETHIWSIKLPSVFKALNFQKLHQFQQERRFILKKVLAAYLNLNCDDIYILTTSSGKPYLPKNNLNFNISHTHNYLLIALNLNHPIGIDVEYLKARNIKLFSERFWGNSWYQQTFKNHPDFLHSIGFYKAWTQTEAWVKAKGETIFNHSTFHPKVFPFTEKTNHENFTIFSFMPYINLLSSLCVNKSNLSFYQKTIDLSLSTSYQAIISNKDYFK